MGLLLKLKNGDTAFKSLRYGNDVPGGGDSGQPFIKTPIPKNSKNLGATDGDGILRGGILAPTSAKDDVLRLTKYFSNTKSPEGLLFTVKQNLLSRVSPKTIASYGFAYGGENDPAVVDSIRSGIFNEGIYTPLSTIAQAGVGWLGTHLNKQGLDPTGAFPDASLRTYQSAVSDLIQKDSENNPQYSVPKYVDRKIDQRTTQDEKLNEKLVKQEDKLTEQINYKPPVPESKGWTFNFRGKSPSGRLIEKNSASDFALDKWYRLMARDERREKRYAKRVQNTKRKQEANKNALNELKDQKQTTLEDPGSVYYTRLLKLWYKSGLDLSNPIDTEGETVLTTYSGGPGSSLGIGNTQIKFATSNTGLIPLRTGKNRIDEARKDNYKRRTPNFQLSRIIDVGVSSMYESFYPNIIEEQLYGTEGYFGIYNDSNDIQPWIIENTNSLESITDSTNFNPNRPSNTLYKAWKDGITVPITKNSLLIQKIPIPVGAANKFAEKYGNNIKGFNPNNIGGIFIDNSNIQEGKWVATNYLGTPIDNKAASDDNPLVLNPNPEGPASQNLSHDQINQKLENFYKSADKETGILHPSYAKTRREESLLTRKNSGRKGFPLVRHERRVSTGDPGRYPGSSTQTLDKVNARTVYSSKTGEGLGTYTAELNDFVHFRIGIIDPLNPNSTKYMNFRSLISGFSDNYNAQWKSIKYSGRGENFYKYQGFERDINFNFTVAAMSQGEMYGIYDKLNYLASSIAPKYTGAGIMTGNMAMLTIGGYCYEQPGIIGGFTFSIPDEASWELNIGSGAQNVKDELPMMIEVSGFKFTPTYNFVPEVGKKFITRRLLPNDPHYVKLPSPPLPPKPPAPQVAPDATDPNAPVTAQNLVKQGYSTDTMWQKMHKTKPGENASAQEQYDVQLYNKTLRSSLEAGATHYKGYTKGGSFEYHDGKGGITYEDGQGGVIKHVDNDPNSIILKI
jgi:hypothetical protein